MVTAFKARAALAIRLNRLFYIIRFLISVIAITPPSSVYPNHRIMMTPIATIIAARILGSPNGSRKYTAPIIAAKITLVSRKEETMAIGPRLMA